MIRLLLLLLLAPIAAGAMPPPEPVTLPGPDGLQLRGVLMRPGTPRPGSAVIALHGCAGLGAPDAPARISAHESNWAERLAALGHAVLFPDSYGGRGFAQSCDGDEHGVRPEVERRADALAALHWLQQQGMAAPGGGVLLGWSRGGTAAMAAASEAGEFRAAIAFYPGCQRLLSAIPGWHPAMPVLLLLGEGDTAAPAAPCQQLASEFPQAVEAAVFPSVGHGFDAPDLSWRRLLRTDARHHQAYQAAGQRLSRFLQRQATAGR